MVHSRFDTVAYSRSTVLKVKGQTRSLNYTTTTIPECSLTSTVANVSNLATMVIKGIANIEGRIVCVQSTL